ncbi:L-asparaginase [Candidatus Fermentibacteria bacterium]|nr:MAG: L-asparaginase [Candidatus Fermentibacteria bacterium]PIE52330.1 MAG: L-asparaginase [Candidatus Fermentibacteria bacterium]
MRRILLLSTGGTIEMVPGEKGFTPGAVSAMDTSVLSSIKDVTIVEERFCNLPSPHLDPVQMAEITGRLMQIEKTGEFEGVVVTHGTDTLEETAFMVDIFLKGTLPVVFTAAMRSSGELGVDGPRNILSAVRVACTETKNLGVTVVLNDEIHAAGRVTKTCTSNVSSFASPGYGPLGFVDDDKVIYHRLPIWRLGLPFTCCKPVLEEKVGLVRTAAGFGGKLIDHLTDSGYRGIVVEAFGRGNVHPETADAIERAISRSVVVAVCSRCYMGRVLGVYGYEGGGADLFSKGAVSAGDMAGNKIRIMLMACLGAGLSAGEIEKLFENL